MSFVLWEVPVSQCCLDSAASLFHCGWRVEMVHVCQCCLDSAASLFHCGWRVQMVHVSQCCLHSAAALFHCWWRVQKVHFCQCCQDSAAAPFHCKMGLTSLHESFLIRLMPVLKSLSALIRALALYCRDSGQVPLSMCLFSDFMAASTWKILLSAGFSGCLGWL